MKHVVTVFDPTHCHLLCNCWFCLMNEPWSHICRDSLSFMLSKPWLYWMKSLLYWIEIRRIWRKVYEFGTWIICEGLNISSSNWRHNKPHSPSMICCIASSWWIAQLSKTTMLWGPGNGFNFGACLWFLVYCNRFQVCAARTNWSVKNCKKCSLFTEPLNISNAITPS